MATRYNINDFGLANPAYVGATVSFWTVSGGAKTATLATLYAASTGTATLANPRTLDSDGKFSVPVYVEVPVIATVSGLTVADHDTGIMGLAESAASASAAAAAVSAAAAMVSENNAETAETNAVAAVAGIGHRKAASVAGTVDAITAVFSPVFASLAASAGIVLAIPMAGANATTTPTLAIDGLTAKTIKKDSGSALVAGDIPGADFVGLFVYDASADCFQMINPSGYMAKALLTAAGDSIVASAPNSPARLAATANVAAHATTMNLWAARENVLTGGAVTVTDIADAPYVGSVTWVKQNAAHVWTDGAVFNVQGNTNYTAAADDWIRIYATTVSTFDVTVFKASGAAAVSPTGLLTAGTPLVKNPMAASSATTQAHGLGVKPNIINVELECTDAGGDAGYALGDILYVYDLNGGGSNIGINTFCDATNVNLLISSNVVALHKTTYVGTGLTLSKWKATVTPYKVT